MSSELVNGIVETAQRFPPDVLAFYGALAFGMAFSAKQRLFILDRDNHRCQARTVMMSHRCNEEDGLYAHHIKAQLYGAVAEGMEPEDLDVPENAITLCGVAHTDDHGDNPNAIHNDQYAVRVEYRNGNKNAYQEMQQRRRGLAEQGIPYWQTKFDRGFLAYARDATRKFVNKGNEYPQRNKKK